MALIKDGQGIASFITSGLREAGYPETGPIHIRAWLSDAEMVIAVVDNGTGFCPSLFYCLLKMYLQINFPKKVIFVKWCPGPDSNRHETVSQGILSPFKVFGNKEL